MVLQDDAFNPEDFPFHREKKHEVLENLESFQANLFRLVLEPTETLEKGQGILRLGFLPSLTPDTHKRNTCEPPITQRHHRQHFLIKNTIMKMTLPSHFHVPQKAERNFALSIS